MRPGTARRWLAFSCFAKKTHGKKEGSEEEKNASQRQ